MTPNIHNIRSKDILNYMLKNWFEVCNQKWSHVQLKNWNFKITIPNHWNKTLNIKTVLSIFRQSWIDKKYFLENRKPE